MAHVWHCSADPSPTSFATPFRFSLIAVWIVTVLVIYGVFLGHILRSSAAGGSEQRHDCHP